ncbi:hypothetical protein Tco_0779474 [Tanacetum coccineum]
MNPIISQQTALDKALVAPDDRMYRKFICNSYGSPSPRLKSHIRTSSSLTRKGAELMWKSFEIFFRSVLDFRIKSDKPPSDDEIISFIKEPGYKRDIGSVTEGFAAVLAVLVTRVSQSRQHGKSESDSCYLSD